MNNLINAFIFALIAAVGNAAFVYGSKKSVPGANPFLFIICCLSGCLLLLGITLLFFPIQNFNHWVSQNIKPVLISSAGICITYLGFYLLYSRFGASYYTLYAVLSIVTTSIIVGLIFFQEKFNIWYAASLFAAFLTIFFFFMGQHKINH
jgi:drug/metabolite transporter (DMT)-like permease